VCVIQNPPVYDLLIHHMLILKDMRDMTEKDYEEFYEEYRALYTTYCMEGGFQISPEGFKEFVKWAEGLEINFENSSDFT